MTDNEWSFRDDLPRPERDREIRIRAALRLDRGPLPKVERRWLHAYYEHLFNMLSFPFTAQYAGDGSYSRPLMVTVVALIDPADNAGREGDNLMCVAATGQQQIEVPLADVEVEPGQVNFQTLDDYWYWFWNWRFDPQI